MSENLKKKIKSEKEKYDIELGEDITKYGEFISSYFAWISPSEQKERATELQNMTDRKKNKQ